MSDKESTSKENFSSIVDLAIKLTAQETDLLQKQNEKAPMNRVPINYQDILNKNISYIIKYYQYFAQQYPHLVQIPKQERTTQEVLDEQRSKKNPFSQFGGSQNKKNIYCSNAFWKKFGEIGDGAENKVDTNNDGLCDRCGSPVDEEMNFCDSCYYLKPECSCGESRVLIGCPGKNQHVSTLIKRAGLVSSLLGAGIGAAAGNWLSKD